MAPPNLLLILIVIFSSASAFSQTCGQLFDQKSTALTVISPIHQILNELSESLPNSKELANALLRLESPTAYHVKLSNKLLGRIEELQRMYRPSLKNIPIWSAEQKENFNKIIIATLEKESHTFRTLPQKSKFEMAQILLEKGEINKESRPAGIKTSMQLYHYLLAIYKIDRNPQLHADLALVLKFNEDYNFTLSQIEVLRKIAKTSIGSMSASKVLQEKKEMEEELKNLQFENIKKNLHDQFVKDESTYNGDRFLILNARISRIMDMPFMRFMSEAESNKLYDHLKGLNGEAFIMAATPHIERWANPRRKKIESELIYLAHLSEVYERHGYSN